MSPHLVAICDLMKPDTSYSATELALKLGRTVKALRGQIEHLQSKGYVEVRHEDRSNAKQRNFYYRTDKEVEEAPLTPSVKQRWPDADPVLWQAMKAMCGGGR